VYMYLHLMRLRAPHLVYDLWLHLALFEALMRPNVDKSP
jgi:hypothetical protein